MASRRAEWAERVQRGRQSGLSARAFADSIGVHAGSLTHWAWRLKREQAGRRARRRRPAPRRAAPARFVEVVAASACPPDHWPSWLFSVSSICRVYGDGAIVVVPAPGHTPGSVIVFVALPDGTRYAFVGDLVWQREGISQPEERPWLQRRLADADAAAVRDNLLHMAAIAARFPALHIVPAHDARAFDELQRLPNAPTAMPAQAPPASPVN